MNKKHIIPAVEKAVALIEHLGHSDHGVTQAELAKELEITGSTCYRIIQTLQKHEWLRKLPGNRYDLSSGILSAAMKLVNPAKRFERCQPLLNELAESSGLSVKLSIRQGGDQITILRAESPRPMTVSGKVGARFPVIEGSVGAALLSNNSEADICQLASLCREEIKEKENPRLVLDRIADIRKKGYCFNARLNRWKVDAMSIPMENEEGLVEAAITLLGFDDDFVADRLDELIVSLQRTAAACIATI